MASNVVTEWRDNASNSRAACERLAVPLNSSLIASRAALFSGEVALFFSMACSPYAVAGSVRLACKRCTSSRMSASDLPTMRAAFICATS